MHRNRFGFVMVGALLLAGCAHTTVPTNTLNKSCPPPPADHCVNDNFDKAGKGIADGSRWVWNESKKGWEWITSDENKKRVEDLAGAAKAAYDSAVKYYNDHKDETNKDHPADNDIK